MADWQDIDETIDRMGEAPRSRHLKNYDDWHHRNINQTYLQLETAQ